MADTVRMVGPDGSAYDIPKEVQAQAFADGLREDKGIVREALDFASDNSLVKKAYEGLTGGGEQVGDVAKRHGQQVLVGEDGQAYVMPAEVAKKALADSTREGNPQFRLPDMALDSDRVLVARAEASVDPRNSGLKGELKAAVDASRDQFVKTATFGLIDPEQDALTETDRAAFQQSQEMNSVGSTVGNVAGFAGAIAADPFAIGGLAGKAGQATKGALGGRALAGIAGSAVEGAVVGAPRATRHLLQGDPEEAAETMVLSLGVGGLLGLGGAGARAAAGKVSSATKAGVGRAAASMEKAGLSAEQVAEKSIKEAGEKVAGKGAKYLGEAAGGLIGGWPGAMVGRGVGKGLGAVVGTAIDAAAESATVQRAAIAAAKRVATALEELPQVVERIGTSTAAGSTNAIARFIGADGRTPKAAQWQRLSDAIVDNQVSPERRASHVAALSSGFESLSPEASTALSARLNAGLDYLAGKMPKDPRAPSMFQTVPWTPSDIEMSRFSRHLQGTMDPLSVVDELKKGTLTHEFMEALDTNWPKLAEQMRMRVIDRMASSPARLTRAQKAQLEILMGGSLEERTRPASVAAYQNVYAQAPEQPKAAGRKMDVDLPSSQTEAQRLSQGRSR